MLCQVARGLVVFYADYHIPAHHFGPVDCRIHKLSTHRVINRQKRW